MDDRDCGFSPELSAAQDRIAHLEGLLDEIDRNVLLWQMGDCKPIYGPIPWGIASAIARAARNR